jgi:sugar/nucleoside kinase (ribokinase family)
MSARSGLLAAGNWIVDKLKVVDTYPQQDALANILSESVGNGGSPFNVLVNLARLKAPFSLSGIGLVGDDADGDWVRVQCEAHGIDTRGLKVLPGRHTSYTDVMTVQSTGRRTFFHQRGANAFLDGEHFDFSATSAKIFHLGYLLLLDRLDATDPEFGTAAAAVLHRASEAGLKTSIDVVSEDSDRFAQVVLPALRHVDYCIINEFEAERTTGITIRREGPPDSEALKQASLRLLEAGVRERVIIHFPEGATTLDRHGHFHRQGSLRVPQHEIVGTVGAGDAFAAGALLALHENAAINDVLRYGVCTAAACLSAMGTSDGIKTLPECLKLADKFGFREVL